MRDDRQTVTIRELREENKKTHEFYRHQISVLKAQLQKAREAQEREQAQASYWLRKHDALKAASAAPGSTGGFIDNIHETIEDHADTLRGLAKEK